MKKSLNEAKLALHVSSNCDEEDSYDYNTLTWLFGGGVSEGTYKIKVGTECNKLGNPDDIDLYNFPLLSGVIDLTRPEQYGKALPLHDHVLIGEEVSVIFTDLIDCERSYNFQMKVAIVDTKNSFDAEEYRVLSDVRKIGFQIDPSLAIDVEMVMGKKIEAGMRVMPISLTSMATELISSKTI